jgi:hypothetical protein
MAQEKTTEVASVHEGKGHDAEWVGNGTTTPDSNATSRGGQLEVIQHCKAADATSDSSE